MERQNTKTGLASREVAVRVFMAVTLKNRPLDITFDELAAEAKLDARDRAFARTLVMLGMRRLGSLNKLMGHLLDRGLPKNATWTKSAIMLGLAQILLMRAADFASANLMVELVKTLDGKEKGFAGLVNAVLRRAVREKDKLLNRLNADPMDDIPDWLRRRWRETYSASTASKLALALRTEPTLDLTLASGEDKAEWAEKLEAQAMPNGSLRRALADVKALNGYEDGKWWVQDLAASLPATLFGDITGKHVLDLCAAPGGKTLQLASQGAIVTALDRSKNRLNRLRNNLDRMGLEASIEVGDATKHEPTTPVDHILLDAPCSATGTYRRNPDVLIHKSDDDIAKLASLQERILKKAFSYLPVGGILIYCTCSLESDEGVVQIDEFLAGEKAAKRQPISADEVGNIKEIITEKGDVLCLPMILKEEGGMDGFYVARITRVE